MNPLNALVQVWWARPYYQYTIGEISMAQLIGAIGKRLFITALILAACGATAYFLSRSGVKEKFDRIGITEEQLAQKHELMVKNGNFDPNFFLGKKAEEDAVDMRIFGKVMGSDSSASFWVSKVNTPPVKEQEVSRQANSSTPTELKALPMVETIVEATPTEPLKTDLALVTSAPAPASAAADKEVQQTWPAAAKPGFDCAAASTQVEKLICNDQELINADSWMSQIYKKTEKTDEIVTTQKLWLKERHLCKTSECLMKSYSVRIKELTNSGA